MAELLVMVKYGLLLNLTLLVLTLGLVMLARRFSSSVRDSCAGNLIQSITTSLILTTALQIMTFLTLLCLLGWTSEETRRIINTFMAVSILSMMVSYLELLVWSLVDICDQKRIATRYGSHQK